MVAFVVLAVAAVVMFAIVGSAMPIFQRLSGWASAYDAVGKRYNGRVSRGFLFGRPSLKFSYGHDPVQLKSYKGRAHQGGPQTQTLIQWPRRNIRLYISSFAPPTGYWASRAMKPVSTDSKTFSQDLYVYSNRPADAQKLLTNGSYWQIQQLIDHLKSGVVITIESGRLVVSKPGFIKRFQPLDDFLRFSLELFDQFQLTYTQGIEFVDDEAVTVIEDVKCPICSDAIMHNMVVCVRCKTPHCSDCWEYNGQCATFACNETRFIRSGDSHHRV